VKPAEDVRPVGFVEASDAEPVRYIRPPRGGRRGYDAMAARLDDLFSDVLSADSQEIVGFQAAPAPRGSR
jgi:hypothetical protein